MRKWKKKMKLYKFRQLGNRSDLKRIEEIIEENKFWCSKLWDLNDPMEGVFWSNKENIDKIFNDKNLYLICSFSGINGFNNLLLWGYYANGFKGLAIEIEVKKNDIEEIVYVTQEEFKKNLSDAKVIITRKFKNWEHENEYRFLTKSEINKQKIGKITKIYFGNPYGDVVNISKIKQNSKSLKKYLRYKDKLIRICDNNSIEHALYKFNKED